MLIAASTTATGAHTWPAAIAVWGPGAVSSMHRHHAVQLLLVLRGRARVRAERRAAWQEARSLIVRPDVLHEVDARDASVLITFVDPESRLGATLLARCAAPMTYLDEREFAQHLDALGEPGVLDAARVSAWAEQMMFARTQEPQVHPRVKRVLRHLHGLAPERLSDTSLEALADIAGLSASRFMHVFTESVGVPLRPYLLWRRVQLAAAGLARGQKATEAAHAAGFSDAAHMTRTMRRMLGTTPSELARRAPHARGAGLASGRADEDSQRGGQKQQL